MRLRSSIAFVAMLSACLPTVETIHNDDTVKRTFQFDGERNPPTQQIRVDSSATTLNIAIENVVTCNREERQQVLRWHEVKHQTNGKLHALLYVVGILGVGAGGGLITDNVINTQGGLTPPLGSLDVNTTPGIVIASIGGAFLLYAIGSSINAADERTNQGTIEIPVPNTQHKVECERQPAANEFLGLVFTTEAGKQIYIPLGPADAQGHIVVSWATVTAQVTGAVRPEGNVVIGRPDQVNAMLAKNSQVPSLGTVLYPAIADPEQAWTVALGLDTFEGYRSYREHFPSSPHATEAVDRAKVAHVRMAQKEFEDALASASIERAKQALATLHTVADAATITAAEERFEKWQRAQRLKESSEKIPKLIAAIDQAIDPATAIGAVKAEIDFIRPSAPDDAARADAQLSAARDHVTQRLVGEGTAAMARRDFATGTRQFQTATTTANDIPAVEKARDAALLAAVKSNHDAARDLAKTNHYDDAIAILDTLIAAAPKDKTLVADRARWDNAAKQLLRTEAERAARAQAEAASRLAREEAARKAQEERAAADQAARDRIAAQQSAREERKRELAAQQAREAEERKQREVVAAQQAEQRKREAEAEKARLKALDQAKAEEAKRHNEELRRLDEAAKHPGKVDPAPMPIRPVTAPPVTPVVVVAPPPATNPGQADVQFELAARYANDDVTKRIETPKACQATTLNYVAKPTLCKDCAARPMSRVDVTCGAQSFTFVRDQTHIWLTCKNDKAQTCSDCLAAGQFALATFSDKQGILQVVKGCPSSAPTPAPVTPPLPPATPVQPVPTAPDPNPTGNDTIDLVDGTKLVGHIQRQQPGKWVMIQLLDGSQQTLNWSKVKRVSAH